MMSRQPLASSWSLTRGLVIVVIALVLFPGTLYASDMTMLMFVFSIPACLVLIGVAFLLAAVLQPSWGSLLAIPIGLLGFIHLYMLPHMAHAEEIVAFALQAAVSSTVLLSIRSFRRRIALASGSSDVRRPSDRAVIAEMVPSLPSDRKGDGIAETKEPR